MVPKKRAKMASFADRLRSARAQAGLSQSELAARAGVPVATVRNLEQGRNRPRWDTAHRLLHAFDSPA